MQIAEIAVGTVRVPLRHPFVTALRRVTHVEDLVVRLTTSDGVVGFGEAPPTPQITGETLASIRGAWEFLAPRLSGVAFDEPSTVVDELEAAMVHNTSAKAALDMALYDVWGKTLGQPVWRLLGGTVPRLQTDITISIGGREQMAHDSVEAVERGFRILKVKVGTGDDMARLRAVREAVGPNIVIRVDANQGWGADEAIAIIRTIEEAGIDVELVEQPVAGHDLAGLGRVTRAVDTPILADEAAFSVDDARRILDEGAADLVNIKLMKSGGITGARRIAALADKAGVACMIGSMLETKLAVNAASHVAVACPSVTMVDLDGPLLCASDPVIGGAIFDGPSITLDDSPGLGVTGIEGVEWTVLS